MRLFRQDRPVYFYLEKREPRYSSPIPGTKLMTLFSWSLLFVVSSNLLDHVPVLVSRQGVTIHKEKKYFQLKRTSLKFCVLL